MSIGGSMTTDRVKSDDRPSSLRRTLWLFVSSAVVLPLSLVLVVSCLQGYRNRLAERRRSMESIAGTIAKLLERPISLGDYALVEGYLSGDHIPEFITSASVAGADGVVLAGHQWPARSAQCRFTETLTTPIGSNIFVSATAGRPTLVMQAAFCDIRSTAAATTTATLFIGLALVFVILFVSRLAVRHALRPLGEAVNAGASSSILGQDLVNQAPEEIRPLLLRICRMYEENIRVEGAARLGEIASQVAHDIRSPLAVLEAASAEMSGVPEDQRIMIRRAASHMRDIANSLLSRYVVSAAAPGTGEVRLDAVAAVKGPAMLSGLVEMLLSEKRLQFRGRAHVAIEASLDAHSYRLFALVDPTEFKRLLSNLVNNAVEALPASGGRVDLDLAARDGFALISVRDNGKGIAPDVLSKLGARGQSHGKPGGSGLGLAHARTCVKAWGGRLELESNVGIGTTATVSLPLATAPSWFVPEIAVGSDRVVVVLDDDTNIHQIWRNRLPIKSNQKHAIELVHAFNPTNLREWVASNPEKAARAQFFLDYHFVGYTETGLDLVAALRLAGRAVLVTSAHDDPAIAVRCEDLCVGLIPKSLARLIPMRIRAATGAAPALLDAILVDDEPLVRKLWKGAAAANGKSLRVFATAADFLAEVESIDRRSPIYIDHDLGDSTSGELVALDLKKLGFQTIYLATGQSPAAFGDMPWISGIVGKSAPWSVPAPTTSFVGAAS